jgi:hypothetical protein
MLGFYCTVGGNKCASVSLNALLNAQSARWLNFEMPPKPQNLVKSQTVKCIINVIEFFFKP